QLGNIQHYPDPDYGELKLALGRFHQLSPDWILPGNGSAELLTLLGREFAQLTATVLLTPAFGDYYRTLAAYNAKVLEFPVSLTGDQGVRSQESGVRSQESEVLPITPSPHHPITPSSDYGLLLNNPHNPTGRLFSRDDILPHLQDFALVVVDEAFMDFLPPEQEQSLIELVQEYDNLVILRSLTKFYSLAGLRLGYAIAHPNRLAKWQSWRDPWPVNTLAEVAAIAALQDTEFQQLTWKWLPEARNQLFQGLSSIDGLRPLEGAVNYLLVESQHSTSELQIKLLEQHRILIRDCQSFKELGDRYFRVAVRTQADNERLIQAIKLIRE
ncbi:MAG: threonine-phosphate decarboxylase, partial [Nostocales cyanobacterium]